MMSCQKSWRKGMGLLAIVLISIALFLASMAVGGVPPVTASNLIPASCSAITSPGSIPAPTVIDFDDLPDGANISNYYQSHLGVTFEDSRTARVIARNVRTAHSAPSVAQSEALGDPATTALNITFDSAQTHVGMYVGNGANEAMAYLAGYDAGGTAICSAQVGPVQDAHTAFIGLHDPQGRIVRVSLLYAVATSLAESIDDLMFANAPATQTPTPTFTPLPTRTPTATPAAQLFVTPKQAAPGAELTLSGYGFVPDASYGLQLTCPDDAGDLGTTNADDDGMIHALVALPSLPPSPCLLSAWQGDVQVTAPITFTLLPALTLALSPQQGPPGTTVHFTAQNLQGGQLRLDYDGKAVFGPAAVPSGSFSGSFIVPNNRPTPLGGQVWVVATNLLGADVMGMANAGFQSQVAPPPLDYHVIDLQLPGVETSAGDTFTITGAISPLPQGTLSGFQIIPMWKKGDGSVFPIGQGPAQILANGQFSVLARLPSLLLGDPGWPEDGDQVRVVLIAPGKAPQPSLSPAANPWQSTSLKVRVIDAQTKQTIVGAKVSLEVEHVQVLPGYGSLGLVGHSTMSGEPNQVAGVLGQNELSEDEKLWLAVQKSLCMPQPVPANQNPLDLVNHTLDQAFSEPAIGGLWQQNSILIHQGVQATAGATDSAVIHYRLVVDALDQGYGLKGADGSIKHFAMAIDYNLLDHAYRDSLGQVLSNPFTVELQKLPSGELSALGPINVFMAGIGAPELPDPAQLPLFSRYYTLKAVPADVQVHILQQGGVLLTLSLSQQHKLGAGGMKLFIDGVFVDDFKLLFESGIKCDKFKGVTGQGPTFYNGTAVIPNGHLLNPGLRMLEVRAQLQSGQWVSYLYHLRVDPAPSSWFSTPAGGQRSIRWRPGDVELDNPWLDADHNEYLITSGAQTDETGPLDNRTQPQMKFTQQAEANGHKGAQSSGQLQGQAINKDGSGCDIQDCPPNTVSAQATRANAISTYNFGPKTEDVVPDVKYDIPGFVAGIPYVASVSVGGVIKYGATVTYEGNVTIYDNASVHAMTKITPESHIAGGMYLEAYILAGLINHSKVELTAGMELAMPITYDTAKGLDAGKACFTYRADTYAYSGSVCVPFTDICAWSTKDHENLFTGHKGDGCTAVTSLAADQQQPSPPQGYFSLASNGFGQIMAIYQNSQDSLATSIWDGAAWTPIGEIPTGRGNFGPKVAFLAPDQALAVWTETNLTEAQLGTISGEEAIKAQRIAYALWDGSSWSAAQPLTTPGLGEGGVAMAACPGWQVGCPAGGAAVAVWERNFSPDFNARQIRLIYATYQNGAWSQPQPLDPASTFTDILPQVAYLSGGPLVAWVRDSDTDLADASSRRIALRFINGDTTFTPAELPVAIGEVALAVDGNHSPILAFTQLEDPHSLLSNRRPLWVAGVTCSGPTTCTWQPHKLVDAFGRTLYAERPNLDVNEANDAIITFRGMGFGGDVEPQPGDAPGMTSGLGDLAQVVSDLSGAPVTPAYLTQDAAVNWMPAAVYDPALDSTLSVAIKGPAPAGLQAQAAPSATAMAAPDAARDLPIVVSAAPNQPDFTLLNITPSAPYPGPGDAITLTVQVANAGAPWPGSMAAPLEVLATWDGGPGVGAVAGQATLGSLDAFAEVTLVLSPPPTGLAQPHELVVTVNPGLTLPDWDAANNRHSLTLGGVPAPTGLWAEVQPGSALVYLDWNGPRPEGVAGYRLYRAEGDGAFQPIGSALSPGYVDLSAAVLRSYRYALSAYTDTGQESALSAAVRLTVPGQHTYLPSLRR